MTAPDGDLEGALRRELSAAAGRVEPGPDALERIRARTGKRPPQPWLLSVLAGIVTRARHFVWHGHWAWQDSLPQVRPAPANSVRGSRRAGGINWLRPVAVLAGVAFIATIMLAVPPLRQAVEQVGNTGHPSGGSGTGGSGSPAGNGGGGPLTNGARNSTTGPNGTRGLASPGATATSQCQPATSAPAAETGSSSQIAAVVSSALPVTTAKACATPSGASTTPTALASQTAPATQPSSTPVNSPTTGPTSSSSVSPTATPPTSPTATATGSGTPSSTPSADPGASSS